MKRLLILAVVLSVLLSLGQISLVGGTGGSISVHKFYDMNGNGVQDPGEPDLEGWEINLWSWDPDSGTVFLGAKYTDSYGNVTFSGLASSYYKVAERTPDCWEATAPPDATRVVWGQFTGYLTTVWLDPGQNLTVEFGNIDTCAPVEGCTPGYWKNLRKHLDEWTIAGYSPGDSFEGIFGVNLGYATLGDAVDAKGGGDARLARFGTAALLNADHDGVNFPLTVEEVINAVNAGNADALATYDELGCPLN